MEARARILGVSIDTYTFDEALALLLAFAMGGKPRGAAARASRGLRAKPAVRPEAAPPPPGVCVCFTPNPEMIMTARQDAALARALAEADLITPDGIGVVLASRFVPGPVIRQRVSGCDLVQGLFASLKDRGATVYLLGGKDGVCARAAAHIHAAYPGVAVAGFHHGYFDETAEAAILAEIQALKPDILLAGLGMGRQEKWIMAHKSALPVKLAMGVGGTLDVLAGTVKRAPPYLQKLGLEWLYRLIQQPGRIGRMTRLPLFVYFVLFSRK